MYRPCCKQRSCGCDRTNGSRRFARTCTARLDSAHMPDTGMPSRPDGARAIVVGIAAISAALLMTELALTRIFSVTMYYHFAFLAISIALFGLSASAVLIYVLRHRLAVIDTRTLLTRG